MNERIKLIRKNAGLTQLEFGEKLRITSTAVSHLESGKNTPSDQTIALICILFDVNEEWLRTGKGKPYKDHSDRESLAFLMGQLVNDPDDFKLRFFSMLSLLPEEEWGKVREFVEKLAKGGQKDTGTEKSDETD